ITCTLILFALMNTALNAQQKVGEYEMGYFSAGKPLSIEAEEAGHFWVYATSMDRAGQEAGYKIDAKHLDQFKSDLLTSKDKFVEWSAVAKANNVTELVKDIPVDMPKLTAFFVYGRSVHFTFGVRPTVKFMILAESAKHVLVINSGEITASD